MGLITDLFFASPEEIQLLDSDLSLDNFTSIAARRIDTIKITSLDEILTGDGQEIIEPVRATEDYESLIFHIRPELCQALANLTFEDRKEVAAKWAQTEEWQLDGGTAEDLAEWLENAGNLARQAQKDDLEMYIRISL